MSHAKFLSAGEAAALVKDGDTVTICGNGAGMISADAILPSIEQFDYYSGGGSDITFLGMGEADAPG